MLAGAMLAFNFYIDSAGQFQLHEKVNRLATWIDNLDESLVRRHHELLTRLLIYMRRPIDRINLRLCRQWNRTRDNCIRLFDHINNFFCPLIH